MAKCDMTKSLGEINFRLNNHGKFNGRKDICVGVWMMHRIIKCSKWERYSEQREQYEWWQCKWESAECI